MKFYKYSSSIIFNCTDPKGLKILTLKQMLQRFPIALTLVKASKISENFLKKIQYNILDKGIIQNGYVYYEL